MYFLLIQVPGCLDSLDFRQRMYQASLAMRISVSFSRLLLNWVATYRHNMTVVIPNSSSVTCIWLIDVRLLLTEQIDLPLSQCSLYLDHLLISFFSFILIFMFIVHVFSS